MTARATTRVQHLLNEGDVVMVCHHLYEQSTCRVVQKLEVLQGAGIERLTQRPVFHREDGSSFRADVTVKCAACGALPETQVDYIEQHWKDGKLQVADFKRAEA